jgi:hypothetical protein
LEPLLAQFGRVGGRLFRDQASGDLSRLCAAAHLGPAARSRPARRGLEGTGSFAAGLATMLAEAEEDVVEITGRKRVRGAKNDRIDAVQATRTAVAREQQAAPRARARRGVPVLL